MTAYPPAMLALADGTVFHGKGIGAVGSTVGEVVFNTSMSGYQEILTDPSYSRQIVTLTYPHIGNTGVNTEDVESTRVHAAGLVIRDLPILPSNFRMSQRLDAYLRAENVVAIAGLDTRKLTRLLRDRGGHRRRRLAHPGPAPPRPPVHGDAGGDRRAGDRTLAFRNRVRGIQRMGAGSRSDRGQRGLLGVRRCATNPPLVVPAASVAVPASASPSGPTPCAAALRRRRSSPRRRRSSGPRSAATP